MARYAVPEKVLIQKILDETVLLDTDKGEYFELNEMGSEMFHALKEHHDLAQVTSLVLDRYDISEDEVRSDLNTLITSLEAAGLIVKQAD